MFRICTNPMRVRLAGIAATLLSATIVHADVPRALNFQGRLSGYNDEAVQLQVKFYDAQNDGAELFSEIHAGVQLSEGVFSIRIGSIIGGIPDGALDAPQVWLELAVDGEQPLPRTRLMSSPYAIKANSADQIVQPGTSTPVLQAAPAGGVGVYDNFEILDAEGDSLANWSAGSSLVCYGIQLLMRIKNGPFGPTQDSLLLDTDDEENGFRCDSVIRLWDDNENLAIELHSDRVNDAPEISLYGPDLGGGPESIELLAGYQPTAIGDPYPLIRVNSLVNSRTTQVQPGLIALHENSGNEVIQLSSGGGTVAASLEISNMAGGSPTPAVEIVATDNFSEPLEGGQIRLFDGNGVDNVEIDSNEGSGGGATIKLKDSAGNVTIELDADYGGGGGPGRVVTDQLEIRGGSDLSERFDVNADGAVRPGMVVCIDPARPGGLTLSTSAYDRRVAGVVSGAGGVRPGLLMSQEGTIADGGHAVALTGRVWTWCDASAAPIEPGDLLTTADAPGHAMRADNPSRAQGAVIGKAMTSLETGRGLVLVLVAMQ